MHHGNIHNYTWKWRDCLEHFNNLPRGTIVNYTEIAKQFELRDSNLQPLKNGGQLVKKFLIENNVNLAHFKSIRADSKMSARRKKLR